MILLGNLLVLLLLHCNYYNFKIVSAFFFKLAIWFKVLLQTKDIFTFSLEIHCVQGQIFFLSLSFVLIIIRGEK